MRNVSIFIFLFLCILSVWFLRFVDRGRKIGCKMLSRSRVLVSCVKFRCYKLAYVSTCQFFNDGIWLVAGIRHALVEKARCPICFSTKCKVEDLLPNLSLRQATERFLKSQIVANNSENALDRYAPGIKMIFS